MEGDRMGSLRSFEPLVEHRQRGGPWTRPPGIHMTSPASCWSSTGSSPIRSRPSRHNPHTRGFARLISAPRAPPIREVTNRQAADTPIAAAAPLRMQHRPPEEQRADEEAACWKMCQPQLSSARSNSAGACQAHITTAWTSVAVTGSVSRFHSAASGDFQLPPSDSRSGRGSPQAKLRRRSTRRAKASRRA